MKSKSLALVALVFGFMLPSAFGQGAVLFKNRVIGVVDAPIFDVDGSTRLSGTNYLGQLYAGPTDSSVAAVGAAVPFLATTGGAGYLNAGASAQRQIPTVAPGAVASVQIRAWEAAAGPTYEDAVAAGGRHGASIILRIATGGVGEPPSLPANLVGLTSFSLIKPELKKPEITTQPQSITIIPLGGSASLTVVASSSAVLSYQWRKGDQDISGATNATLHLSAATLADTGIYTVVVRNSSGETTSEGASVVVMVPPRIVTQPVGQTVIAGGIARFSVVAEGSEPLRYQWSRNWADVSGGSGDRLDLTNVQPSSAGTYRVTVSNAAGSATSDAVILAVKVTLTLVASPGGSTLADPAQSSYASGVEVTVSAKADTGFTFSNWTGDASGSANPVSLVMDRNRSVSAVFAATAGTVNFVNKDLSNGLDAPVFAVDGTTPLAGGAYLAQLYGGVSRDRLTAAAEPTTFGANGYFDGGIQVVPGVSPGGNAFVQVRVWEKAAGSTYDEAVKAAGKVGVSEVLQITTGGGGSPPTSPPSLVGLKSFSLSLMSKPIVLTDPANITIWAGDTATLTVLATGPSLHYQWYAGEAGDTASPIGLSTNVFTTPPLLVSTPFWARVSNGGGSTDTTTARVTVNKRPQVITFDLPTGLAYGAPPISLTAAADSLLPVVYEVVSGPATLSDATLSISGAGTVVVRALQPGNDLFLPAVAVERTLSVRKASASVALSDLALTYDGKPKQPTISTTPPGLAVSLTYSGTASPPVNAGTYALLAAVDDANYEGSASGTLTVAQARQTIAFAPLPSQAFGAGPVNLDATASSALPVSFALVSGPATLLGKALTPTGVGTVVVRAVQAGDSNYLAAPDAEQSMVVRKGEAAVLLGALSQIYDGKPKTATISTTPSGLTVVVTYAGQPTHPVDAGSYPVIATIDDANYEGSASGILELARSPQTITFDELLSRVYGSDPVTLQATSSAGLPVSFALVSGPASLTGDLLTITGAGAVVVQATQSGNTNYLPANVVERTLLVTKASATVVLEGLSHTYDGNPKPATARTTPIGLDVILTYAGQPTPPVDAGSYPVIATIDNPHYQGSASGTLEVARASQTLVFEDLPGQVYGASPVTLHATASTGLPAVFSLVSGPASLNGDLLTITGVGTVVVRAEQPGNSNYLPAHAVEQALLVGKASATVVLEGLSQTYDGNPKSVTTSTTPSGLNVVVTYAGQLTPPVDAGSYPVISSIDNTNYEGSASGTLEVAKAGQTITFAPLPNQDYTSSPLLLDASSSSGLPVSIIVIAGPATIVGNALTLTGIGTVVLRATQDGDTNHLAAESVEQSFTVNRTSVSLALTGLTQTYDGTPKTVTVTTLPAGLTPTLTYDGLPTPPVNVGTYAVRAIIDDANYHGSASAILSIQANVTGLVFNDLNGNGQPDSGDSGVPAVEITLFGSDGTTVLQTSGTDENGAFSFGPIAMGSYVVQKTSRPGYLSTTPDRYSISVQGSGVAPLKFGEQPLATVSGLVFNDLNANGSHEDGEAGLGSVRITLTGVGEPAVITTSVDGAFLFTNVPPGTYVIEEAQVPGYASTSPDQRTISLGAGAAGAVVTFAEQPIGTISGTAFEDRNGNGLLDEDEPGIAEVDITLTGAAGTRHATTATDGSYRFLDVVPGTYLVRETDPVGFASTTPNQRTVSLTAGGAATASFGDQPVGTISGMVFLDRNGDAIPEPGEPALEGVKVVLTGTSVSLTNITSADGTYSFPGLVPGIYLVEETDPAGFSSTSPNQRTVSLSPHGAGTANFGDQPSGTISGRVFDDSNGDGLDQPGEPGLAGVIIVASGESGTLTTATTAVGTYSFTGLTPGAYSVEETDPAGFASSTPNRRTVNVSADGAASVSFGDQVVGTVSGTVFEDQNGNGRQDSGEPGIGGVLVVLVDAKTDAELASTTTAIDGHFVFGGVVAGDYVVRQAIPDTYTVLVEGSSHAGARDVAPHSSAAGGNFQDKPVSLGSQAAAGVSFGMNVVGSISGTVFDDLDGDARMDGGESGLGGVEISLLASGQTVPIQTALTTLGGAYLFNGITPGAYVVKQTAITGYTTLADAVEVRLEIKGAATVNFVNRSVSTVSGRVFQDENHNGLLDTQEFGMGGVHVSLTSTNTGITQTTTTAGDGSYLFTRVENGNYSVEETVPSGFTNSTPTKAEVVVGAGGASLNFGNWIDLGQPPTLSPQPAALRAIAGTNLRIAVVVQGTEPFTYRWQKDGQTIANETNAFILLAGVKTTDAGRYTVQVANRVGLAISDPTALTVIPSDPLSLWAEASGLPDNASGPADDADHDGVQNFVEFALALDPKTDSRSDLPRPGILTANGKQYLTLTFKRTKAAAGAQMLLSASDDLVRWQEVATPVETLASIDLETDLVRLVDTEPMDAHAQRFLRLLVNSRTSLSDTAARLSAGKPNGEFRVVLQGLAGSVQQLQVSSNLVQWTTLTTLTNATGYLEFTDTDPNAGPIRFYRIRQ